MPKMRLMCVRTVPGDRCSQLDLPMPVPVPVRGSLFRHFLVLATGARALAQRGGRRKDEHHSHPVAGCTGEDGQYRFVAN